LAENSFRCAYQARIMNTFEATNVRRKSLR
jgi:hypothetical protein